MTKRFVSTFIDRYRMLIEDLFLEGMTQENVADELGVSPQTVSAWHKGIRSPMKAQVAKIAKTFNVNIDWLLGYDVPKAAPENPTEEVAQETDGDLSAPHEQLGSRPGMRFHIDASKNATEQDLLDAAALIEGFKRRRDGEE